MTAFTTARAYLVSPGPVGSEHGQVLENQGGAMTLLPAAGMCDWQLSPESCLVLLSEPSPLGEHPVAGSLRACLVVRLIYFLSGKDGPGLIFDLVSLPTGTGGVCAGWKTRADAWGTRELSDFP